MYYFRSPGRTRTSGGGLREIGFATRKEPRAMSYIPSTDAGLEAWALNFKTLLAASPTTYGLTSGNATSVTTVYTAWHSAYLAAADLPSRTKIQVQAKNTSRTNLLAIVRPFAQQIRANAAVLDADKVAIGVT